METDNRHHTRAKVKWPVSINAPTGIVDGTTENLSLSGAFIRLSKELSYSDELPLVLKAKGRLIPCSAEVVWSDEIEVESYTYGARLRKPVDQIEELIRRYLDEQNDRQVTLVIRVPDDIKRKVGGKKHEPPCLSLIDTEIFHGKLHLTSYFRSWDAYAGLPANIAGIQLLNEAIVSEINDRGNLNVKTGKLIFHSKNCHIYERQFKIAENLLEPKRKTRHKFMQPKAKNQKPNI